MSKYEYPRVHKPSSLPQPGPIPDPESRPYSWVNTAREPEDGRFGRQSVVPPLPRLPDHLNPALHSTPTQLLPQPPQPLQPPQPSQPLPAPTGQTPVPVYTADARNDPIAYKTHPTHAQAYQLNTSVSRPPQHRATHSNAAPEVIKQDHQHQQPVQVSLDPDVNPLESSPSIYGPPPSSVINLPVYQAVPPPSSIPTQLPHPIHAEYGGSWKYNFCSCADTPTCLTGLFCPCVLYGKTQYRLARRSDKKDPTNMLGYSAFNVSCAMFAVLCGCNWILAAIQHTRIRQIYKMSPQAGGIGGDCVRSLCCCCCTLAQDEKEVKWREMEARRLDEESMKTQYQTPGGMRYPGPPK